MSSRSEEKMDGGRISRRAFAGLGAAAGATVAVAALPGVPAVAGPPPVAPAASLHPEELGKANPALTYATLDAFAFFPDGKAEQRIYQDITGVQPATANTRLSASLPVPSGSTIFQLNVAYQGQPLMEIWKRSMVDPTMYSPLFQQTVPMSAGPGTHTFALGKPVFVEPETTVAVRFFATAGASVFGVTVGYSPPSQSFIPFTGSAPRILDTRMTGGKIGDGEERMLALGFPGARGAVINLTLAETEGFGGFVAIFPANIAWPGNSSINWSAPNQFIANGVITAMDSAGQIKIRGGAARTQVVIDRIGWLI
jgi:hypothetical protein